MALHRATYAEINIGAFRHNLEAIRSALGPSIKTMAVVKADGYGHGAVPCAKAALEAGSEYLGVGIVEEGIELREAGITTPIQVLCGIFPEEADDLIRYDLSTTLNTRDLASVISEKAAKENKTAQVHIKVDTGMNRLGVRPDQFLSLMEFIHGLKNIKIESVFTHFASADDNDSEYTLQQIARFNDILEQAKKSSVKIPLAHTANSSALLKYPQSHHNLVRPGLILYGALPSPSLKPHAEKFLAQGTKKEFQPVMQWKTRIIQINPVTKGSPVSYGQKFIPKKDSLIATLPVGYADGLHRTLSNKINLLVRGKKCPQVGTICMDLCLLDVTEVQDVKVGDEVVIFGRQGDEIITVDEVAETAGTIPYEILCAVGKRVPRKLVT